MSYTEKYLLSLGLSSSKCTETMKNTVLTEKLVQAYELACTLLKLAPGSDEFPKSLGNLIYGLVTKSKPQIRHHTPFVVDYIVKDKICSQTQITEALGYLLTNVADKDTNLIDTAAFEAASGVGIVISPSMIEAAVEEVIQENLKQILAKGKSFNAGQLLGALSKKLKFADAKHVKSEVDVQLRVLLNKHHQSSASSVSNEKKLPGVSAKNAENGVETNTEKGAVDFKVDDFVGKDRGVSGFLQTIGERINFHKPGENYKTDGYVVTKDTMGILKKHLTKTGGQVITRFPPEPNGILHIGHAKAINFNFGYAKAHSGITYLRYDDTNPEKEEEKFFLAIQEMVKWLGYTPFKITHASDYFEELYILAERLIDKGLAYVCHQRPEEVKGPAVGAGDTDTLPPSPWRDRPISESRALFRAMRQGRVDEGAATLRMRWTMDDGKVDPVAYRVRFSEHCRTGNCWCVYPTYDFTHCLCDSMENITHSLCTKEFQIRDWDDPRLFTLTALRRRGVPAAAVNLFCAKVGVTVAFGSVNPLLLDACIREILNVTAVRGMAVLDPLPISIKNFDTEVAKDIKLEASKGKDGQEYKHINVEVPDFPADLTKGTHTIPFTSDIYIERSDFMEVPEKGYKRLGVRQSVGLRHCGYNISVTEVLKDKDGMVCGLIAECTNTIKAAASGIKPAGFIHWVSAVENGRCQVNLYNRLFKHKNPEDSSEVPGGFLSDVNSDSLTIVGKAVVDNSIVKLMTSSLSNDNWTGFDRPCMQFERVGFFALDDDSKPNKLIFNRTVELKEDKSKKI